MAHLTETELAAIRKRDALDEELWFDYPDSAEKDRRALLAHIDAITKAATNVLDAFGSEAQSEPGPSRASQRAAALDVLRALLRGTP